MTIDKVKKKEDKEAGTSLTAEELNVLESVLVNKDINNFIASTGLISSEKSSAASDKSILKKEISHQILLEPAKAVSPNNISKEVVAANTTAANSFMKEVPDKLKNAGELSQKKEAIDNKQIKDCVKSAAKKCATVAATEATSGELAHGNTITATHGNQIVAANSMKLHTDTSYTLRSPQAAINAQDYLMQANNSASVITDTLINQNKNSIEFAENSKITQSTDSLEVATNASDRVSKLSRTIGVERNTSMGKLNQIVADEKMIQVSGNTFSQASYGDFQTQSSGNINIIATPGSKKEGIALAGLAVNPDTVLEKATSINIVNENSSSNNILSLTDKGNLFTTTGNSTISAVGAAVVSGTKGVANVSDKVVYLGGSAGGVIVKGSKLFLNAIPIPVGNFTPPKVLELPELPEIPELPKQQLENCIPDKFKPKGLEKGKQGNKTFPGNIEDFERDVRNGDLTSPPFIADNIPLISLPTISDDIEGQLQDNARQQAENSLFGNDDIGTIADSLGDNPDRPTKEKDEVILNPSPEDIVTSRNNQKNSPQALTKESNVVSQSQSDRKLPGVTVKQEDKNSAADDNFKKVDVGAMTGGGFNIYPDRIEENSYNNLFGLFQEGVFDEATTLDKLFDSQDELELFAQRFREPDKQIDNNVIKENLKPYLQESVIENYSSPELFLQLASLPKEVIDSFNITKDSFSKETSKEIVDKALELIKLYPQSKPGIKKIIEIINAVPAIGFLGLASSMLGGFGVDISSNLIDSFSSALSIPNFIANDDFTSLYNLTQPVLSDIFSGSLVGDIIDNPTLNNIGKQILAGEDASEVLEKNIRSKIESELTKKLPDSIKGSIPSIRNLILNIQSDKPLEESQLIGDISTILARFSGVSDFKLANTVYGQIKDIVKVVNDGDLLKLVTGSSLEGLVSTIAGGGNLDLVKDVFGLLRDTVGAAEAIALLPDLIDLMNQYNIPGLEQINIALSCLDLFNKVRNLLDKVNRLSNKGKNKAAASLIEQAPRMVQSINSINSSTDSEINSALSNQGIQIDSLKNINIPISLDLCFKVPELTLAEADVDIISVDRGVVQFAMSNTKLLSGRYRLYPKNNDVLQIRVEEYIRLIDGDSLYPYQTEFQYTPFILNFIIVNYDINANLGIAKFDNSTGSLILEESSGVLYEFNETDLGSTLELVVNSSYLLA